MHIQCNLTYNKIKDMTMTMTMIPYNKKFVPYPFGLNNSGAICWFNSLIQSLLSCSSFNELCISDDKYKQNAILSEYLVILKYGLNLTTDNRNVFPGQNHSKIIRLIQQKQSKSKFRIKLGSGQQDADEGLKLLIDTIDNKDVLELFQIRYRAQIYCGLCKNIHHPVPSIGDPNFTVEIAMDVFHDTKEEEHANIIQKYIIQHNEYIDNNYVCTSCNKTGHKIKMAKIRLIPEVLIILFKKYTNEIRGIKVQVRALKRDIKFPQHLEFNGTRGNLKYTLVSQCEHSGALGGGHYWSISQRKQTADTTQSYNLNDTGVNPSEFRPTSNTYLVFYNYIG